MIKPERLAQIVLDFKPAKGQRLWPAFIGGTGCGKTTRALDLCARLGRKDKRLLPGTKLPEDILGIPKVENGVTHWTLPEWAKDCLDNPGKYVVFIDEIDKARPEALATILTLLAEGRIHDTVLPDTLFICAGQPVPEGWVQDETTQAISARLVWLPVPEDWDFLSARYGVSLEFMGRPEPPKPPILEAPSMRQVEWALQLIHSGIAKEHEVRQILRGLMPEKYVKALMEAGAKVEEVSGIDAYLALEESERGSFLQALSPAERAALAGEVMVHPNATKEAWACAILACVLDRDDDLREKAFQHQYDAVLAKAGNSKVVDLFGDTTREEFTELLNVTAACGIAVLEKILTFDAACDHIHANKFPDLSKITPDAKKK